jgi:hypothetical protein
MMGIELIKTVLAMAYVVFVVSLAPLFVWVVLQDKNNKLLLKIKNVGIYTFAASCLLCVLALIIYITT